MSVTIFEQFHILALSFIGFKVAEFTPRQESALLMFIIIIIGAAVLIIIFMIAYLFQKARQFP